MVALAAIRESARILATNMNYVSVRTATLRPDTELLFDVYILYQDTYLRYKSASQTFDGKILDRFKAKKVKKVFIPEHQ